MKRSTEGAAGGRQPATRPTNWKPLVGKQGTLYGYIDPERRVIEFKRKGLAPETINLDDYLKA